MVFNVSSGLITHSFTGTENTNYVCVFVNVPYDLAMPDLQEKHDLDD